VNLENAGLVLKKVMQGRQGGGSKTTPKETIKIKAEQ